MQPELAVAKRPASRSAGLDIARVAAIALVLIAHFVKSLQPLGVFGVELFFALSGFLIGGILYRALLRSVRWSFSDVRLFWARRWYRTLPNYLLFLLIALPFHAYFGGLPSADYFLFCLVFAQNLMSGENSFYGVSWSLAVEEWFYLLFPAVLLLLVNLGLNKRRAFIGATVVFLIVPALLREVALQTDAPASVRLMTLPRLDAIFYGVGVAVLLARTGMGGRARLACLLLGSLVAAVFLSLYALLPAHPLVHRLSFLALPASFALMLPWLEQLQRLPNVLGFLTVPIEKLSVWSYSIYLSHIPVLFTVYALFGSSRENALVNGLSKVIGLVACMLISRFIYEHFEKRFTAMRPGEPAHGGGLAPIPAARG